MNLFDDIKLDLADFLMWAILGTFAGGLMILAAKIFWGGQ